MSRADRGNGRKGSPLFRWVAAGSAAVFLTTSAYQASWGQGSGGDNNGGGLSASEEALIATGAAVGAGLIWVFLLGGRRKRHHDDDEKAQRSLPEGKKVSELRLLPTSDTVEAGDLDTFDLQARDDEGSWYSVTDRDSATVEVGTEDGALVTQDGAKNVFCLPITTPARYNGKTVTLVGKYQTDEGRLLSTRADVTLHVAGEFASAR